MCSSAWGTCPTLGRQFLAQGLVDEIGVHIVPVLFGDGVPMFGDVLDGHVTLEVVDVIPAPSATHVRYRIVR